MERSGSRWIRANPLQSDVTVHWPKCWTANRNGDICHSSPLWQPGWCPPVIPLCIAAGLQLSLAHRCNPMDRTERGCYIFCSVHFFMHPVLGRVLYYLATHINFYLQGKFWRFSTGLNTVMLPTAQYTPAQLDNNYDYGQFSFSFLIQVVYWGKGGVKKEDLRDFIINGYP